MSSDPAGRRPRGTLSFQGRPEEGLASLQGGGAHWPFCSGLPPPFSPIYPCHELAGHGGILGRLAAWTSASRAQAAPLPSLPLQACQSHPPQRACSCCLAPMSWGPSCSPPCFWVRQTSLATGGEGPLEGAGCLRTAVWQLGGMAFAAAPREGSPF